MPPADPDKSEDANDDVPQEEEDPLLEQDPRFHQPSPSLSKRAALIVFTLLLFWLALSMRTSLLKARRARVIYAPRYSKEHKFRPAASPVITETLKDGRTRIRGGAPTATPEPKPIHKKKKKTGVAKRTVKRSVKVNKPPRNT